MSLDQWTVVAAGNASLATGINWAEGQAPSTVNDSARQMMADLRAEAYQSATLVAAGTTDLSTATGSYVPISGNTTITGLGTMSAGIERKLRFTGTPLLVHNGTSLILPGAVSHNVAAGDLAHFVSEGGGNWRCLHYQGSGSFTATLTGVSGTVTVTVTYTKIGDNVTLCVPDLVGTSTATTKTLTGMPAAIRPSAVKRLLSIASDNGGGSADARVDLASSGVFTLYPNVGAGLWTASGAAVVLGFQMVYTLA